MVSEKEVEAALSAWNNYSNSGPVAEDRSDAMRVALEAAARVRADEKLPCDVQLPGVKLKRGVRLSTLLMAIRKRKNWPEEQTKLPRDAEYLRHLERAMMLDPDPEYRAQAKAEYLKLTSQDEKGTR